MADIQIMSDVLANKIAAGEVVERPASVVKELVENSLDAGATEIDIELQQGGLELIRVSDNGFGIDQEDVPLAFERHATSKIKEDRDLFRIASLGFRGEALPSIAAVSRVELKTRKAGTDAGTLLKIEGGHVVETGPVAAKKGTELLVEDLFFNTPARLKYLKSIQTELGHTIDYIERMSMVRPNVAFRLVHNNRSLVQTPGDGKLLHAVAAIYGRELAKQMVPVEWEDYDYKVTGLAGFPELNRANRNHATFYVNGRYIKSYQLFNAVQAAYHTLLPINRYPVCVLHVQLDPSMVDCNVHPTKLEVRFSEEKDVFNRVQTAVRSALEKQTFIPKAYPSQPFTKNTEKVPVERSKQPELPLENPIRIKYEMPGSQSQDPSSPNQVREPSRDRNANIGHPWKQEETAKVSDRASMEAAMDAYRPVMPTVQTASDEAASSREASQTLEASHSSGASVDGDVWSQEIQPEQRERRIPKFRPVAQTLGMYIVAEDENGLYIIDQHAAHEKVLYEKFSKKLADREIHQLPLLVPLTVELSPAEGAKLEKQLSVLADYQLDIERFGGDSFIVRSVPDIWGGLDVQRLTSELLDELLEEAQPKDPRALIEDKIIMKSCKSAIKANQWLSMPEMTALCDQLSELDNPFTCPHGRPIIIHMTRYDLEKQFKRVM